MNQAYVSRLRFFSKVGLKRAISTFCSGRIDNNDVNDFLSSLLEKGDSYEYSIALNTVSFAISWNSMGKPLTQHILTRVLYLCFLEEKFTNPFIYLLKNMESYSWLFFSLGKIMDSDMHAFKRSIENDWRIWDEYLFDVLFENVKDVYEVCSPDTKYRERETSFIGEVFPFYWEVKSNSLVKVRELLNYFCGYCLETNTKTSLRLFNLMCMIFTKKMRVMASENYKVLERKTICFMLKYGFIDFPKNEGNLDPMIAIKALEMNPDLTLKFVNDSPNSEEKQTLLDVISLFDKKTHKFNFTE